MDLQTLLDERDIVRALSRFARILDNKEWNCLTEVFSNTISFDYGTGEEQVGISALRSNMTRYLDCCGNTQHLIGSIVVDVQGDEAISRAYVQARHQGKNESTGTVYDTNGEYVDQWERQKDGWKIIRRDAIWSMFAGNPAVIGRV
ncbi:MAG: nuclear transport factor 2 family protein [Halioglobus sp.]